MPRWRGSRDRNDATGVAVAAVLALLLPACGDAGAHGDAGGQPDGGPTPVQTESASAEANMADRTVQDTSWIPLFDGTDDLSAWRGYRRSDMPRGWQVRDGLLMLTPGGDGGDIITRDTFGDFELALDWRVGPGGNSGVFYRATEDFEVIWYGAPEVQVLGDAEHPDGGDPATSAGALYALYPNTTDAVKPAGEWNALRVVARGPHVEHWLNGVRVVEYEAWSEDWNHRVAASKFAAYPGFGEARAGHIGLQDHGDTVWYRDIRIRPLPASDR